MGKLIRRANDEIGKCVVHRARETYIYKVYRQLSSLAWQVGNTQNDDDLDASLSEGIRERRHEPILPRLTL